MSLLKSRPSKNNINKMERKRFVKDKIKSPKGRKPILKGEEDKNGSLGEEMQKSPGNEKRSFLAEDKSPTKGEKRRLELEEEMLVDERELSIKAIQNRVPNVCEIIICSPKEANAMDSCSSKAEQFWKRRRARKERKPLITISDDIIEHLEKLEENNLRICSILQEGLPKFELLNMLLCKGTLFCVLLSEKTLKKKTVTVFFQNQMQAKQQIEEYKKLPIKHLLEFIQEKYELHKLYKQVFMLPPPDLAEINERYLVNGHIDLSPEESDELKKFFGSRAQKALEFNNRLENGVNKGCVFERRDVKNNVDSSEIE